MKQTVLRLLSPRWRTGLSARFATATAEPLERVRATARLLGVYLTPTGAPASWLDWLLELVGHPARPDMTEARKRALLAQGVTLWARKGRADAIEDYLRAVAGVTAQVVPTVGPAAVAGVARAGDVCGPGLTAWTFEVEVPAGSITEGELRELLAVVVPTFTTYTVTFT